MPTVYDQHMHTHYSFDSTADLRDYLQQAAGPVITTEHLEFANPDDGDRDDVPNYIAMRETQAALAQEFPNNRLLLGIEVGYFPAVADQIRQYLAAHPFDLTLLSFHHDGHHDYQDASFRKLPLKEHVQTYYQRMLAGLHDFHAADVLAHFDYGLRVLAITPAELTAWAKPLLDEIFAYIVRHHLAFELNTKSMYKWHNAALYDLVIPWYQAAGGTLFTIGSDAHEAAGYENHFLEALSLLHRHGVNQIVTFDKHQPSRLVFSRSL